MKGLDILMSQVQAIEKHLAINATTARHQQAIVHVSDVAMDIAVRKLDIAPADAVEARRRWECGWCRRSPPR